MKNSNFGKSCREYFILKNKKIKFYFFLLLFLLFEIEIIGHNSKVKICLCTIGKEENRYIKEYIEHYRKYGVDKIFLYDNNNVDGEKFEEIIPEFIKKKYVEIINIRGKKAVQLKSFNHCYQKHLTKYNWFIFYDIDEFIFLRGIENLKYYLSQSKFNKCQVIQLNWVMHGDNNLLHYSNKSLKERFPEKSKSLNGTIDIKSIIRGNIKTNISSVHYLNPKLISCDGFGKIKKGHFINGKRDTQFYYIDHYYTKSTEEFIAKMMKGDVAWKKERRFEILPAYFDLNKITLEKIQYIENKTLIKLNKFKEKIE